MITFKKLLPEHLELVLRWRTLPEVTKYMFTDITNSLEDQYRWYDAIACSDTEKYWIVSVNNELSGLISLNQMDLRNKKTSWGFYIGEESARFYGGLIPPYFYNYIFGSLGFNKLIAEIMEGNNSVIKLHKLHGYREVGVYREHIYKYAQFHDVIIMELTKDSWEQKTKQFGKYIANFE
jgi:UDP-4-amino-4,6-dideoxy-N-acetyl-beta-L-altrosamine N-acetyltransferase